MDPTVSVAVFGFSINLATGFREGLSGQCLNGAPVYICSCMHGKELFVPDIFQRWKNEKVYSLALDLTEPEKVADGVSSEEAHSS